MRYIHFFGNAGFCGTDYHKFLGFNDAIEDSAINEISAEFAHDNAENFSYLVTGWGWDGEFESEEEEEQYYENAANYCDWEELSKEDWENLKEDYQ